MKRLSIIAFVFGVASSFGQVLEPADCIAPTATAIMEFNQVRARIENGGLMWQNRTTSQAQYEVPAGGGVSALYAGSFWAGGVTESGQLKLAANTFSSGDYAAGPLAAPSGSTNSAECLTYDEIYGSYRLDVVTHVTYHQSLLNGTVNELFPSGYNMPDYFESWPAHGDVALGQDHYLAPFLDFDGDGAYHPEMGDAPGYDLGNGTCEPQTSGARLSGDANWFWIFNDAGRSHSESQGEPIGLEVRAQSWAFADGGPDFDNATFYTYEILNQGPFALLDFQTAIWVDADVGTATDDYVGCDVSRGLAFAYNGDSVDEPSASSSGYGENPPAVGLDFFYGLSQDPDGIDNPQTPDLVAAVDSLGIPYAGLGFGYGDGVVDNERFGMRRFVYYNNGNNPINGEPVTPLHFYNYMNGIWKNGQKMAYGGDGVSAATGANLDVSCDYMFPGDSDPLNWGTAGADVEPWSEVSSGNPPADRRFLAACGPISLDPGERNEIVFGVVWARGEEGPASSVQALLEADDRIQALFDNCFEGLGCSDPLATNYEEDAFFGSDGACTYPPLVCGEALPSTYLANLNEVSLVTDSVVVGFGEGPDAIEFIVAAGDSLMLFQTSGLPPGLSVDVDEVWPSGQFVCIQPTGLPSTLGGFSSTWSFLLWEGGVPSELVFSLWWEVGFSALDAADIELVSLPLTRIQGRGSGRKTLRLSAESEEAIVMSSNGRIAELTYKAGLGPLDVFVLGDAYPESTFEIEFLSLGDPLETPFELRMLPDGPAYNGTFTPDIRLVSFESVGLAVAYDGPAYSSNVEVAEVLGGNVESTAVGTWWEGIPDAEGFVENNWIRSGTQEGGAESAYELVYDDLMDEDELYEGFLGGTWAPYSVVSYTSANVEDPATGQTYEFLPLYAPTRDDLERTQQWNTPEATTSVAVVFTPDRSKWTRCPVLEMQPYDILAQNATGASGTLEKMNLRRHVSVDKDGMTAAEGGNATDANLVSGTGMGWFPGYAIDVTSGERLNMAFGEDSWLSADNGKDMLFNPSSSAAYFGGQHWIYVFKNGQLASGSANRMPSYDGGAFIMTQLADPSITNEKRVFRDCAWVGSALSVDGHDWDLPWSEFSIHLDVALPLTEYSPNVASEFANSGEAGVLPLYRFTTENLSGCTDLEAFNFETNALLDDGSCVDAADACLADSLGLIAQLGLTTLPEDTLFWSPETPGFLLSVEGDLEVSPGQFLSLDNARVDSIAGLPDGVSLDGLAPDDILYANTCVELTGLIAGNCYDVEMHLNLEASFFGVTIPAGTAVVEISICSAGAAVFGCTYQHALNFDPMATSDDGACLYVGCTDTEAINFNALFSLDDGSCLYDDLASECIGDIDLNGSVGSSDLLLLLVKFGLSCED